VIVGEDNMHKCFVSLREGSEFPMGTRTIEWPAYNVDTFMPFTGVPGSRDRASRPDHLSSRKERRHLNRPIIQDGEWVEYMAKAPSATDGPDPFAVILDIPVEMQTESRKLQWDVDITSIKNKFFQTIRYHLSNNRAVIVRPWFPESNIGFSVDEIGLVRSTTTNTVHWQGQKARISVLYS
jgi:hypothetical protein